MPPIKTIVIGLIAVLIIVALISIKSCDNANEHAAQSEQTTRSTNAHSGAAEVAVATVVHSSEREASINEIVETAAKEISNAEGSNQKITPAMRAAALRAACRLRDYSEHPACQVHRANP